MIHHAKSFLTQGESSRFKPFKQLDRQLLWHGSRTSNYAGILSTGLRIAPPEAPVTGYMFGKGLYFADMVSKSANYTHASKQNPTGLMLLCDVALAACTNSNTQTLSLNCPRANTVAKVGQGLFSWQLAVFRF